MDAFGTESVVNGVTIMIRVFIERHFVEGMQEELERVVREVIQEAVHAPGYLSGEILRNLENPNHFVVISNWRSRRHWEKWLDSDQRRRVMSYVTPMLMEPERITVMEPV